MAFNLLGSFACMMQYSIAKKSHLPLSLCTGDVAVDWITDKVYIVERNGKRIQEYDLGTQQLREVVSTGESSKPVSVAVYPYPGEG